MLVVFAIYVTVFSISNTMLNLNNTRIKFIIIIQLFPTTTRITIHSKYFSVLTLFRAYHIFGECR